MQVSVVIPCYNDARTIGQAIESVLAQTNAVLEVIVVDDGSGDDTSAVVAAIHDPRVRYLARANGGASAARNTGLEQVRGDWIAFLDADDWWTPTRIASAEKALALDPSIEFMQCNRLYLDASGGGKPLPARPEEMVDVVSLLSSFRIKTSAVMVARAIVDREQLRFPVDQKTCEDYHLFWRAAMSAQKIGYVDDVEVMIRQAPQSLSRSKSFAFLQQDNIKTLIDVVGWAERRRMKREYVAALKGHLHWQLRDYFLVSLRTGKTWNLIRYLGVAWRQEGLLGAIRGLVSAIKEFTAGMPAQMLER